MANNHIKYTIQSGLSIHKQNTCDFYNPTDPENNQPLPPGHDNGHGHEIQPAHANHMTIIMTDQQHL